jgi:hypothetical protein
MHGEKAAPGDYLQHISRNDPSSMESWRGFEFVGSGKHSFPIDKGLRKKIQ